MQSDLGLLEDIWDVWTPSAATARDDNYFPRVAYAQVDEVVHHLTRASHGQSGEREAAWAEMVDIIAVALDWMRHTGADKGRVAAAITDRVKFRYRNNTDRIVASYNHD